MSSPLDEARPGVATPCVAEFEPVAATGTVSFYFPDHPRLLASEDMPRVDKRVDAATLRARLEQMCPTVVVIERVGDAPAGCRQHVQIWRRLRDHHPRRHGLKLPARFVSPTKWKRHFGLDADKEKSRALAPHLWPARADRLGLKRNLGRAEAASLACLWADTTGLSFPSFATASQAATRPSGPPHAAAGERECRDATVSEPIPPWPKGRQICGRK